MGSILYYREKIRGQPFTLDKVPMRLGRRLEPSAIPNAISFIISNLVRDHWSLTG